MHTYPGYFLGVTCHTSVRPPSFQHPLIANPDFKDDKNLFQRCKDCAMIGFELWQVKSGTMFDDIIVTDSLDEAKAFGKFSKTLQKRN